MESSDHSIPFTVNEGRLYVLGVLQPIMNHSFGAWKNACTTVISCYQNNKLMGERVYNNFTITDKAQQCQKHQCLAATAHIGTKWAN